jgi:pyrroloquinoline quinone (PQQ) biosynthesis protein C
MPDAARTADAPRALPVDEYLRELDALVAAHDPVALDALTPAIAAGAASRDVVRRVVLESYHLGRWTAPELAVLIANAPDVYSFTMEESAHYHHWARRFVAEVGYLGHANHVQTTVEWCRQLGLDAAAIRAYTPLPETIAMACTALFYVRRTYEEGLAVAGYLAERIAAGRPRAKTLADGLRAHYGVTTTADETEPDPTPRATDLFRQVATTPTVQDRCRAAVRNVLLTAECRVRAMNRWVA